MIGTLGFGLMIARTWVLGRDMRQHEVVLDERGVNLHLGTKKEPADLLLRWEQVSAVTRRRVGRSQRFWVLGKDGSQAMFTSYTFFRPKKVARLIGERAGVEIQKI